MRGAIFLPQRLKSTFLGIFFKQNFRMGHRSIAKQLLHKYLWYLLYHVLNFILLLWCMEILIYYCLNEPFFVILFILLHRYEMSNCLFEGAYEEILYRCNCTPSFHQTGIKEYPVICTGTKLKCMKYILQRIGKYNEVSYPIH